MGNTIMGAVVTLDGYIADINGDVGPLFDWYSNGDVALTLLDVSAASCRKSRIRHG